MKKVLQRILAIACMVALTVAVLPAAGLRAADKKPGKPKISVKAVNGTDVEITIQKTKGADGYEVWITSDWGCGGYRDRLYSSDYINAATVEKDGTAVRTVTIKKLSKSSVSIKVRAYKGDYTTNYESCIFGDFSKEKTVKVKAQKKGYKTSYDFSKVKKGDTIKFGTYEQDYPVNGKDPIEWVVLDKTKTEIFVMSKYVLDGLPFNYKDDNKWDVCSQRKWLNKKFINAAFNKTEKSLIRETTLSNKYNFIGGTPGCDDTKDKVFLLSIEEVINKSYGFDSDYAATDINRRCAPTKYAVAQGVYQHKDASKAYRTADNIFACGWLLRSPGRRYYESEFESVSGDGYIGGSAFGVRPAIKIFLNESIKNEIEKENAILDKTQEIDEKEDNDKKIAIKQGDIIKIGSYEQDNDLSNGKEPIEWIVLSNNGSELFVLSKYGLDYKPMNDYHGDLSWESCSLRTWLNNDFYNTAFTDKEKDLIKTTLLKNNDNPEYGTNGGNDTNDKIFLLSIDEIIDPAYGLSEYDPDDDDYTVDLCCPSDYALDRGCFSSELHKIEYPNDLYPKVEGKPTCTWWLRSPGKFTSWFGIVDEYGYVCMDGERYNLGMGYYMDDEWYSEVGDGPAVRPAMIIKLEEGSL